MTQFCLPAYGRRSICDVLPAAAAAIGHGDLVPATGLELPPRDHYVVLLIDGLGQQLIAEHPREAPFLHEMVHDTAPGTCSVPSTTATSLTSLGTGLPPGQHGVVGFTQRVPETGALLNSLFWDQPVDPLAWQPEPTVFAALASAGIATTVVSKGEFADSGLTRCALRGAAYVATDDVDDRISAALSASEGAGSLTFVYDGDLDHIGHRSGVDSERWRAQLQAVDEDVQDLRAELPASVGLVVTADHGMVDATASSSIDVDALPGLRDDITLLGGEARMRHLYCSSSAVPSVARIWRETLADRATVLTREEAVERGWFGPIRPAVAGRIGDVVVAAHDNVALFSSRDFSYEMTLIGLHGSLTPREMEIPILVV